MDYAHELIDKRIEELEERLHEEYSMALAEIKDRAMEYFDKFTKEDIRRKHLVYEGKLDRDEYLEWRKNKILYSRRYNDMINDIADKLTKTDEMAIEIVADSMLDSFEDAANYTAYEIEKAVSIDDMGLRGEANFYVYNRDAVDRIISENPSLLPRPKVPVTKDFMWNKQKLNSAIVQGILQGDSIPRLANRLQLVTDMDRRSAIRNARTMHTSAESAGRQRSYERAQEMGIEIMREWVATHDNRTRDAHRELDGVQRPLGVPFHNSIGKIRYPADPEADPANVYNCRCTLRGVLLGHPYITSRYSGPDYEAWKQGRKTFQKYLEEQGLDAGYKF